MLRFLRNARMERIIGLVLFLVAVLLLLRNRKSSSSPLEKELMSMSKVYEDIPWLGENISEEDTKEMNNNNLLSNETKYLMAQNYDKRWLSEINNERDLTKITHVENHTKRVVTENAKQQDDDKAWLGEKSYQREVTKTSSDDKPTTSKEEVMADSGLKMNEGQTQMEDEIDESYQEGRNENNLDNESVQTTPLDQRTTSLKEGEQKVQPQNTASSTFIQEGNHTEILPTCNLSKLKTIGWFQGKAVQDFRGTEMFEGCDYSCCTLEKVKVNRQEVDVLVFEAGTLHNLEPPPKISTNQAWAFYSIIPDVKRLKNISAQWNDAFNWTLTYREDSDIYMPYMTVEKDMKPVARNYGQIISMKDKKSIWIENRCKSHSTSKAFEYVTILKRYIDVDVFGENCPMVDMGCINYCHDMFERYKFAFAFEPLLCKDFITHQFCEILQHNIIPVVRGVGNYSQFVPKSSFINTEDFKSIEDLGRYLNYLDTNETAYAEYLQSKEGLRFNCLSILTRKPAYCDLCKMAHNMNDNRKTIPNVFEWMSGECFEATDLIEHTEG